MAAKLVHHALSLGLHAGVVAALALASPHVPPAVAASPADENVVTVTDDDDAAPGEGGDGERSGTGIRSPGGGRSPDISVSKARASRIDVRGPRAEPEPHLAHDAALREAASFGLATGSPAVPTASEAQAPSSPWGGATSEAAKSIEDALGPGGLVLSGAGEGSGGRADAMGLTDVGALARNASTVVGGMGSSGMFSRGAYTSRGIREGRGGCRCSIGGRLVAEIVQRIVRMSFGRFRGCYEQGLLENPTLEGRVTTKFLIAPDGSVAAAADGGSELPDASVVSCVVRAFASLSFPALPRGAITVEYPIAFSPE